MVFHIGNAQAVEQGFKTGVVGAGGFAEIIGQARGAVADFLQIGVFAVQDAQRIGVHTAAAVFVQRGFVLFQVAYQGSAVGGAFFAVAQAVDFQSQILADAELAPQIGAHGDDFGIDIGAFKAQRFHAHLVELAVAPFLRAFAAEHGPHIPQLLAAVVQQIVLHHGAQAGGGAFGAQAEAEGVVGVGKGIHFFAHHIGVFADGAHEKAGLLHDRGADLAVAKAVRPLADAVFKGLPEGGSELEIFLLHRQEVVHAFYGLDFLSHGSVWGEG